MVAPADEVPNPRYVSLLNLKRDLADQRLRAEIVGVFDFTMSALASRDVWTGPAATAFHKELAGRKAQLAQLYSQLATAVDTQLRHTPQRTTRADAASQRQVQRVPK